MYDKLFLLELLRPTLSETINTTLQAQASCHKLLNFSFDKMPN